VVLATAAHYTYEQMPVFNWIRDALGLARNHFDRVGHFFQGFTPALVARELFARTGIVRPGRMLAFIAVCVSLAVSAFWELLEWWVVVLFYPDAGMEWLGVQGDFWDAQWDMFLALVGALTALAAFSRLQDRSVEALAAAEPPRE
jgi:putative membrane protein